jgi:hypothetical protein
LEREAEKVGLKINEQKAKYMIDVGHSVAIGDKHFEVVKEFVYLESLMTPTNDVSLNIQHSTYLFATFHARQNSPFTRP